MVQQDEQVKGSKDSPGQKVGVGSDKDKDAVAIMATDPGREELRLDQVWNYSGYHGRQIVLVSSGNDGFVVDGSYFAAKSQLGFDLLSLDLRGEQRFEKDTAARAVIPLQHVYVDLDYPTSILQGYMYYLHPYFHRHPFARPTAAISTNLCPYIRPEQVPPQLTYAEFEKVLQLCDQLQSPLVLDVAVRWLKSPERVEDLGPWKVFGLASRLRNVGLARIAIEQFGDMGGNCPADIERFMSAQISDPCPTSRSETSVQGDATKTKAPETSPSQPRSTLETPWTGIDPDFVAALLRARMRRMMWRTGYDYVDDKSVMTYRYTTDDSWRDTADLFTP